MLTDKAQLRAPEELLSELRWGADMVVPCPFSGDPVWLKEFFVEGKRVGITECCFADAPCDWHAALANLPLNAGRPKETNQ